MPGWLRTIFPAGLAPPVFLIAGLHLSLETVRTCCLPTQLSVLNGSQRAWERPRRTLVTPVLGWHCSRSHHILPPCLGRAHCQRPSPSSPSLTVLISPLHWSLKKVCAGEMAQRWKCWLHRLRCHSWNPWWEERKDSRNFLHTPAESMSVFTQTSYIHNNF